MPIFCCFLFLHLTVEKKKAPIICQHEKFWPLVKFIKDRLTSTALQPFPSIHTEKAQEAETLFAWAKYYMGFLLVHMISDSPYLIKHETAHVLPKLCMTVSVVLNFGNAHLQVVQEFGSFRKYCWSFVNHKPITNCFRYARQVPTKTPKAEAISKDLMRRGFQCVGPTTIYSFMQVAGIVNDHLSCCFRFKACQHKVSENNVRAEPALPESLSSPSSEDSDIRVV